MKARVQEGWSVETATWVMAGASVLNVLVLIVYACFTWGIWKETREGGRRTEDFVRQAREALRLQVVATYMEEKRPLPGAVRTADGYPQEFKQHLEGVKTLLQKAFPEQWGEIERTLDTFPETRIR